MGNAVRRRSRSGGMKQRCRGKVYTAGRIPVFAQEPKTKLLRSGGGVFFSAAAGSSRGMSVEPLPGDVRTEEAGQLRDRFPGSDHEHMAESGQAERTFAGDGIPAELKRKTAVKVSVPADRVKPVFPHLYHPSVY